MRRYQWKSERLMRREWMSEVNDEGSMEE